MGFFDMFKFKDINEELAKAKTIQGSVILDVRSVSEYSAGAARMLKHMGYENIVDMGGISRYHGEIER